MKITLDIQDNRFDTFMDLIQTLDYVSINEEKPVPEWQQQEVSKRLELVNSGEMKTRSWDSAKKDLFKK
ncbi:Putative addiction module component [Reichenbachiella agariperforans]|uniref:Putative addiction module component n=1 Tax=Reichenbachiella agariperforans TaxID=156994 RepID=A0A1M6QH43_REIAG|nr:addiction module protein [Reichenbachiella agariperforans]SHK19508.1 Putative addiction module component [Reichenbachiella agariperforans]